MLSYDAESVDKEYYNAVDGPEQSITVKPTTEAITMPLSRRAYYYAMAVGVIKRNRQSEPFKAFRGLSGMFGLAFFAWYCSKDRTVNELRKKKGLSPLEGGDKDIVTQKSV